MDRAFFREHIFVWETLHVHGRIYKNYNMIDAETLKLIINQLHELEVHQKMELLRREGKETSAYNKMVANDSKDTIKLRENLQAYINNIPQHKFKQTCPKCDSDNVIKQGKVKWNVGQQNYVTWGVPGPGFCNDCNKEVEIKIELIEEK